MRTPLTGMATMMAAGMMQMDREHTFRHPGFDDYITRPERDWRGVDRRRPRKPRSEDHPLGGREPVNGRERAIVREWQDKLRRDELYARNSLTEDLLAAAETLAGAETDVLALVVPTDEHLQAIQQTPGERIEELGLTGVKVMVRPVVSETYVCLRDGSIMTLSRYLRLMKERDEPDQPAG